jgi:hypothetical protein
MKDKVRIYYESLEQAVFFLKPIVEDVFGKELLIELIEISKTTKDSVVANKLGDALAIRNPDGIISWIKNDIELPLVWLEFSTQVETLDHLSQSFNSFPAAGSCRIPVVKIYASRRSRSAHGGAQAFDPRIPFQILFSKFNTPGVQLDWPVTDDGRFALRNAKHRACPQSDLGLKEILLQCKKGIEDNLDASDSLIQYAWEASTPVALNIRANLKEPAEYVPSPRSTRFFFKENRWTIKFNRWGHSMDPERGLAELYHNWLNEKLSGVIHDEASIDVNSAIKNFSLATGIKISKENRSKRIDITSDILTSSPNRAGLIIAWCCNEFTVADDSGKEIVNMFWEVEKPAGLQKDFSVANTTVVSEKTHITEDDVTFVLANRFFPQNGFEVHSVSYPGAQGDFALVTGNGRTSKRKYFDAIAYKQESSNYLVVLSEAKGEATPEKISKDVDTVLNWRDDNELRKLLLDELNFPKSSNVLSSLAYSSKSPLQTNNSEKLDFVLMVNKQTWHVWAPYKKNIPGITVASGKSDLPIRYVY